MSKEKRFAPEVSWDPQVEEYLKGVFGNEKFRAISQALCQPPRTTCVRVNTLRASPQEVIDAVISHNHTQPVSASPAAAQAGDAELACPPLMSAPYVHPRVPMAVMLPGEGPLPVDYSVTGGKEVVISRKAGEAVLRGAPVYAPGVLACSAGVSAGDLVALTVAVELPGSGWCGITRGTTLPLPVPSAAAGDHASTPPPPPHPRALLHVGVGRAALSRAAMFRAEQGLAVEMVHPVFRVPGAPASLTGSIMLQNLPSLVAALALAPTPGANVLDMCAAPGGKTTLLAQIMGGSGKVTALDRTHAKAAEIMSLAAELGLSNVVAYKMDAGKCVLGRPNNAHAQGQGQGQQQEQGDAGGSACVDAPPAAPAWPCGGEGAGQAQPNAKVQARVARKRAAAAARGATATRKKQPPAYTHQQGAGAGERGEEEGKGEQAGGEAATPADTCAQGGGECSGSTPAAPAATLPILLPPPPPGFEAESFHCVLLDAPCSALGLRPRLNQQATTTYLKQCGVYTRRLLDAAVRLVKPGGRLVFSTCTISPWENEASVRYVLDKYGHAVRLVPALPRVGGPGLTGAHPTGGLAAVHVPGGSGGKKGIKGSGCKGTESGVRGSVAEGGCAASGGGGSGVEGAAAGSDEGVGAGAACKDEGCVGREGVGGREVWLSEEEAGLVQRFDPACADTDTTGFFVAAFEKTGSLGADTLRS